MQLRFLLEGFRREQTATARRGATVLLASHEQPSRSPSGYGQALAALDDGLAGVGQKSLLVAPYKHTRPEWVSRPSTPIEVTLNDGTVVPLKAVAIEEDGSSYLRVQHRTDEQYFSFDSYRIGERNNLIDEAASGNYGGGNLTSAAQAFNLAVVAIAKSLREATPESPIVVHGHDHITALAVILAKQAGFPTAFTIHNPAYTTLASVQALASLGLADLVAAHAWGGDRADLLALAMAQADVVSTVSGTYAGVLSDRGFAYGPTLVTYGEVLYQRRFPQVIGIPNSLSRSILAALGKPSATFRMRTQLNDPVKILVANRLSAQKGYRFFFDGAAGLTTLSILEAMGARLELFFQADGIQDGQNPIAQAVRDFAQAANKIRLGMVVTAGYEQQHFLDNLTDSDLTVQPSEFEPHGLFAVTSQAAGTLPLVTAIDGLYDSIGIRQAHQVERFRFDGRGIGVAPYGLYFKATPRHLTPELFWTGIAEAVRLVKNEATALVPQRIAMREHARAYTPERMAERYMQEVYEQILRQA